MTESSYYVLFGKMPVLQPNKSMIWPLPELDRPHNPYCDLSEMRSIDSKAYKDSSLADYSHYDRCVGCGEQAAFCRCKW